MSMSFATALVTLIVAHEAGDHLVQDDGAAQAKVLPGWEGHRACASHVASYTATAVVALAAVAAVTGARPRLGRVAAGLALSAGSHYVLDRRVLLQRFAERTGKGQFYQLGRPRAGRDDNPTLGTGGYAMDQAAHKSCLFLAALVIAGRKR